MVKKKKVVRFRELFDVIDEWLRSYNFDDTAELLRSEHDLDLTTGTLKSYVHRHRKYLAEQAEQSVIKDELVQHSNKPNEIDKSLLNPKVDVDRESLVKPKVDVDKKKEVEEKSVSSAPSEKVKKKNATPEELKAALAKMQNEMTEKEYKWEDLLKDNGS